MLAQEGEGVVLGGAGVDGHRHGEPAGQVELGLEGAALVVSRGVVAVVVEAGLADRAGVGVGRGALDLLEVGLAKAGRLVRVASDDREHLLVLACRGQRAPDRSAVHADRREPGHPGQPGALDQLSVGRLAVVEVAVGVDHGRPAGRPRRASGR